MTLEKAIEILFEASKHPCPAEHIDFGNAIKLGTEALNQVLFYRSIPDNRFHNLLKGETKD